MKTQTKKAIWAWGEVGAVDGGKGAMIRRISKTMNPFMTIKTTKVSLNKDLKTASNFNKIRIKPSKK